MPGSLIILYCAVAAVFLGVGIWLAKDLSSSRAAIITERSALAVQTSGLLSQRFGNTITATDYVLRDVTTKVTVDELHLAATNQELQKRLSALVRDKLTTLPNVFGLSLLDDRAVFIAAADETLIGYKSNSKLNTDNGQVLENRAYVDYVPPAKSANKQPAILVSRPILSSDGNFLGGGLAAIMLSSAQDWIESFNIGEQDTMAMVDESGVVLALNPSKPDLIGTQVNYNTGLASLSDLRGSTSFTATSPIDGRERIYGFSKVENVPLYIIVGFDIDNALREWRQRLWQISLGFVALIFLVVILLRNHMVVLKQREEMRKLSSTDPLTGVANRRQLILSGEIEFSKTGSKKGKFSVLMVDIDNFKSINDAWGHPAGDQVIKCLTDSMLLNFRNTDIVGRLGGDEFAVFMPETDSENACVWANRLREIIEGSADVKSDNGTQLRFTVSIGVASSEAGDTSFEEILACADKALYDAKCNGRNRVCLAHSQGFKL